MDEEVIREWSKDKLALLGKYLHAYSKIMQHQKQTWLKSYAYIDVFANAGVYRDPETLALVDDSPLVALNCDPPFDEFWFIERNLTRLDRLKSVLPGDSSHRQIRLKLGDSNAVLTQKVAPQIRRSNRNRGFVFLDPYGFQVDWATIMHLAEAAAFDIFVNFPIMGVNRILARHRKAGDHKLDGLRRMMGRTDWLDEVYATQDGLFGDVSFVRGPLNAEKLARLYIADVEKLFGHASAPVIMRNSANAPLYALFLASHNATAVKITNQIFGRRERLGA